MILIISSALLFCVTQAIEVTAQVSCIRIEQLQKVSDAATLKTLESYLRTFDSAKPHSIRKTSSFWVGNPDRQFFMVTPDSEICKSANCYYRLIDVRNGVVNEAFSFEGTGVLWFT